MPHSQRRTALFYDAPLSTREDLALLKGMLLFFDDIAVFSTPQHRGRLPVIDPQLCAPLVEGGLLRFVDPRDMTTPLTEVIVRSTLHRAAMENADHWLAAAAAGDWDLEVPRLQGRVSGPVLVKPREVSESRGSGSLELFKLLAQDGWLLPDDSTDDDGVVVPGMASVENSILALAACATARARGWAIEPVATRRDEGKVFTAILDNAVENVGASDVVMSDLSAATLDLTEVQLDDILAFRSRHRRELRTYVVSLQALLASAPTSPDSANRSASLVEATNRLRELQLKRWPKVGAGASVGIIGATWTLASGDLLGALIGAAGSQLRPDRPTPVSAYAYILRPDDEPAD